MDHHSAPQPCGNSEVRLCDNNEVKQGKRTWVPLRDVLQGEGNYGPKALFYTHRDTFASTSAHLSAERDDAVKAKRRFNLEIAKRQEARALSTALLCLRRDRLCQVIRCDAGNEEQHQPSQKASTLSSLISSLPPLSSLLHR
ncbi:unnamed protein product [Taenia asiatica]|uniref:Protein kinase domain-containing protein n=1 Tax=Taenia asiatica TaxID=60517 RepID=A0A0R3W700_TAEAS|nr:unnamed protein product [Taenia asiatica]